MEDTLEHEHSQGDPTQAKDADSQYLDCIRLVEGGHIRRFENFAAKFDIVHYESNPNDDGPTKPLLFYAIEHGDETFVKVLLEMEVSLNKSYLVSVNQQSNLLLIEEFSRSWLQHHRYPMPN